MITQKTHDRRKTQRLEKCGDYFVSRGSVKHVPCTLKNISVTGACIVSEMQLSVNQIIDLHICRTRDLSLSSQVVWIKDSEYGLVFMLDTAESFKTISFIMNNELHQ